MILMGRRKLLWGVLLACVVAAPSTLKAQVSDKVQWTKPVGRQLDLRRSPIGDRDDLACFDCADRYRTPYSAVGWLAHLCLSAEPLGN
jgi:hypothetical protein